MEQFVKIYLMKNQREWQPLDVMTESLNKSINGMMKGIKFAFSPVDWKNTVVSQKSG